MNFKQGDKVYVSGGFSLEAVVSEIDGNLVSVWWPCPEFGRHSKVVPSELLTLLDGNGSVERHKNRPRRTKDQHLDHQVYSAPEIREPSM